MKKEVSKSQMERKEKKESLKIVMERGGKTANRESGEERGS